MEERRNIQPYLSSMAVENVTDSGPVCCAMMEAQEGVINVVESRCGLVCSECSYREPTHCPGCSNTTKPFWGECRVKSCCEGRQLSHCGDCQEFPCKTLTEFSYDQEQGDNGKRIEQCRNWAKVSIQQSVEVRAASIMKDAATATIALLDDRGFPRASTISSLKTDGIKHAWFATGVNSGKVRCLRCCNKASLCYSDGSNNVTLIGTVDILSDSSIKRQMWLDWFIKHFPGGVDDPNYCILQFTTQQAVFWVDSIYHELSLGPFAVLRADK